MRTLFPLLLLPLLATAQIFSGPRPTALIQYLTLTPAQLNALDANNANLQRVVSEKVNRQAQLMREISIENNKTPLDPMALGLRYAEVETICRDIRDAENRARQDNIAVLTEPQRVRLRALEEAVRLVPVAQQAESMRLADFGAITFLSGSTDFASLLLGFPPTGGAGSTCPGFFGFSARPFVTELGARGMSVDHRQDPQQHQK